ncbi:MAG: histone H1 [Bacteroidetes bacterium]|nr:histone H1 [Bacteroidota bacterium]
MTEQNFDKINDKLNSLKEEFEKFYTKNNKAAGTRIRKGMQELKVLAQEIRVDVQNRKTK